MTLGLELLGLVQFTEIKMRHFFKLLILGLLLSSCVKEKILPSDIKIEKLEAFYLGIFDVKVFRILTKENIDINTLRTYPNYYNILEQDEKLYNWKIPVKNSSIYENIMFDLEVYDKNQNVLIDEYIYPVLKELKKDNERFLLSGVYTKVSKSDYFYIYYILDRKQNILIKATRISDF